MCWWLWKRKGWWLWCSFVLAQIHVGIPRSMHCWHCSESYHFVGFEIRITPNYWKTKRPPHYLLTWKIATQIVEQKKAMKIPGMPNSTLFYCSRKWRAMAANQQVLFIQRGHIFCPFSCSHSRRSFGFQNQAEQAHYFLCPKIISKVEIRNSQFAFNQSKLVPRT